MIEESDIKLLRRAQKGDNEAFEKLFRKYYEKAVKVSDRILNNHSAAEDIVMDSFLDMYVLDIGKDIVFGSYFMRVVVNNSLNEFKKNKRFAGEYNDDFATNYEPDPFDTVSKKEFEENINTYLNTLPVNQKTAFVLVKEIGYSYKEVASIMNTTEKSVEALLWRARKKLQAYLKDMEGDNR